MVLESTLLCVDNSEYMRNGDFLPTRLQAQQDAVGMITQAKLRSNPESNVGLMSLSDLDVLSTLTTDTGKVLAKLHAVQPKGQIKLIPGLKIAHLALKHRLGKNHKTRIITFIGSPIEADEKELIKVAKKLKKEKVSVDVVSFGEVDENAEILKKFVETINGRDGTGSHLVTIPPGPHLSDALISSAIIQEDESSNAVVSNGSGGFQLDFDPNDDPELALALRVSMEENRARLAQDEKTENDANELQPNMKSEDSSNALSKSNDQKVENTGLDITESEDSDLALAIRMSMETSEMEYKQIEDSSNALSKNNDQKDENIGLDILESEDPELALAIRMSMETSEIENKQTEKGNKESDTTEGAAKEEKMDVDDTPAKTGSKSTDEGGEEDYSEVMNDPEFLQSVLESLPGVDPQSEAMRQAMGALTGSAKKEDKDEKKNEDKDKK